MPGEFFGPARFVPGSGLAVVTADSAVSTERTFPMNSPAKLTDAQLVILSSASQREDLRINVPDKIRSDAANKLLATLIKKGLIEFIPESEAISPTDIVAAGAANYRISALGLARLGVGAVEAIQDGASKTTIASPPQERRARMRARNPREDVPSAERGLYRPAARKLKTSTSAEADNGPTALNAIGDRPSDASEPAGSESLRHDTPAPQSSADGSASSRRPPRAGSKLDQVIALLSSDAGAKLDELTSATGWLPHTARAAITGLRHRGYDVRLQRGGDGSASVYRLALSGTVAA
jgi:Protein of unknown function (DUF3489)